jgi:hypothetical protein
MPGSSKIIQLRKFLAERFPQQKVTHLLAPTGWSLLDALLGGGLPKGAITQLIIPHISAGGAIVLHEMIEAMHQHSQCVALIDGKNSFEPSTDYPLLLWIRCQDVPQALKATDLVLRDSNLPLRIQRPNSEKFPAQPGTVFSALPRKTKARF